ncbi:O-antigen ligase family protein [Mobilicoccus caccae]|uniref:O-antigen ligase-related domain-containing protein n=1 Tax=Mobilicoccus caccae TaxID=1859295 RepID=A0ABQ6ILV1_9MICO|nr:O-antigen ligase family protein [Mobilicoccus caccae]GMA38726.1 hypothetical protein GCM10025883_07710 [Mobilicoccus caccae]
MSRPITSGDPAAPLTGADGRVGTSAPPRSVRDVPFAFYVLLAALLLNVFSGRWSDMGLPLGPDRLLFAGGLILLLLDPRIPRPRPRLLHAAMLLFTTWAGASMILHDALDTNAIYAVLDRVAMPFLLFATAPMFLRGALERLLFLRGLTLLGVYLTITAFLETAGLTGLLFPRYIAVFENVPTLSDQAARAGGPFVSGEANGMALALCAVAAFLLARLDRRAWRVLGLVVGPLAVAASVLSLTRSVWLGVALAAIAVVATRRALWQWVPLMVIAGALLAVVGLAAVPDVADNILERGSTSRSLDDRQNSNVAAVRAIADDPVTGVGWAQFVEVGPDWVRQAEDYPVTTVNIEVHNVLLSRAAELGVPAALLFIGILLAGPVAAICRRRRDPEAEDWRTATMAAGLIWFVPAMTSPIPYPFPTFVVFTLAGLLWAFPSRSPSTPPPSPPPASPGQE